MRLIWATVLGLVLILQVQAVPSDVETSPPDNREQSTTLDEPAIQPPPLPRGQQLYENHCTVCHDSVVHVRSARKTKDLVELRGWVERWSNELGLKWGSGEVNDVVMFLNGRFYHF